MTTMDRVAAAQWLGAAVAVASAPFVAIADGLVVDPTFATAPAYAQAMRNALAWGLDFAAPPMVMRAWQLPLALGALLACAPAWWRAGRVRDKQAAAAWRIATALALVLALGVLLESVTGEGSPMVNVALGLYIIGIPLAMLAALLVGLVAFHREAMPRVRANWFVATPFMALVLTILLRHFPAPQLAAFAIAWAAASTWGNPPRVEAAA